jgi:hypothetical protein
MSLVNMVLEISREADSYHKSRSLYTVQAAMSAEMGEVSEEVAIAMGDSYKTPGPDGVNGEAVDLIVAGLDLLYVNNRDVTEEQIMALAIPKLEKWIDKIKKANAEGKID